MNYVLGAQVYGWGLAFEEEGRTLAGYLDEALAQVAEAGLKTWETMLGSEAEAAQLQILLHKHGLRSESMYVGAKLHEADWPEQVQPVLLKAGWGRDIGVRVVTVNPDPIDWNSEAAKTDEQLRTQALALNALGRELRGMGLTLAYHTHAMEMRHAAREFHHMLVNVPSHAMGLCLDTHWIYRGAGNSQCALEDILLMHGKRIVTLHLRQSHNGIWSETLEDGDIDYRPLAAALRRYYFSGPIILELAREAGTPRTLSLVEAHRRSREWITRLLTE